MKWLSEARQSIKQLKRRAIDGSTEKLGETKQVVRERLLETTTMVKQGTNRIDCIRKEKLPEIVAGTLKEARKVADAAEKKLSHLNLRKTEWILRSQVVGSVTAAIPLALKELPAVAQSLANRANRANRAGGVASDKLTPDKLFDLIPTGVKLSEESIMAFLKTHDVSHRISIKNDPTKSGDINNVIFESSSVNRARRSQNMSRTEFRKAQSDMAIKGVKYGIKNTVGAVTRGMLFGALLELPITVIENTLHVKNNGKAMKTASVDAVKDVGKNALLGGASAAALTGLSLLGVTLGPAAIPLAIVGGVMYTWSATDRIWQALDDETKKKLTDSEPVLFLASVARCGNSQDYISSLKILPN